MTGFWMEMSQVVQLQQAYLSYIYPSSSNKFWVVSLAKASFLVVFSSTRSSPQKTNQFSFMPQAYWSDINANKARHTYILGPNP